MFCSVNCIREFNEREFDIRILQLDLSNKVNWGIGTNCKKVWANSVFAGKEWDHTETKAHGIRKTFKKNPFETAIKTEIDSPLK
ncbi:hypothetical protein LEP1GSC055_3604 [Leptospira borgpetersenii str. Brem 307]|uniref:Uncharacterized protein n=1 Tax=Leptospira borgpetersenii str. Brem 328 TaxID=1049780 RepID=A0ABC9SDI0_LEPBO|nr:hypothetical protein LEP1GSC055_3604 [Leptospira borgpetersenii str. Brem 307]EMN15757.1 hypothetical protein LEP1GSC056_4146 [Leptospira borgpetersenii str. Brem 328]